MTLCPWAGTITSQHIENVLIGTIVSTLVPKAEHDKNTFRGGFESEVHHSFQIGFGMFLGITFMRMQGDLDFMGTGFYHTLGFGQKGAIGGKDGYKILPTGYLNEFWQMRMQERLAHQVEVQELDLSTELVGQRVELLHRKTTLGSVRLGTEQAIEVTDIGYF
jgi:hypothetical protein